MCDQSQIRWIHLVSLLIHLTNFEPTVSSCILIWGLLLEAHFNMTFSFVKNGMIMIHSHYFLSFQWLHFIAKCVDEKISPQIFLRHVWHSTIIAWERPDRSSFGLRHLNNTWIHRRWQYLAIGQLKCPINLRYNGLRYRISQMIFISLVVVNVHRAVLGANVVWTNFRVHSIVSAKLTHARINPISM